MTFRVGLSQIIIESIGSQNGFNTGVLRRDDVPSVLQILFVTSRVSEAVDLLHSHTPDSPNRAITAIPFD